MKQKFYRILIAIVFIPFFLTNLMANQRMQVSHHEVLGDFIVSLKDFKFQPKTGNQSELNCEPQSIEFKPQRDGSHLELTVPDFCTLWHPGSSFSKIVPNATLVFHQGGNMYQMVFKIPAVTQVENTEVVSIRADAFDPKRAFSRDGEPISQSEFINASQANDKKNISLMVDSDPWDPRH